MLVLIAGGTGLGKSTLAGALARSHTTSRVLGTSDIREVLRTVMPQNSAPNMFRSTFDSGTAPLEDHFEAQCFWIHAAIGAVLARDGTQERLAIVEGIHVTPRLIEHLPCEEHLTVLLRQPSQTEHASRIKKRGSVHAAKSWAHYAQHFTDLRRLADYIEELWGEQADVTSPSTQCAFEDVARRLLAYRL